MKVLLSIKPEYAFKIFDGSKKYEYRRVIFKRSVKTIVVYVSDPIKRIIGEFDFGKIINKNLEALWAETSNVAGTSRENFLDYFKNQEKGYAIEVLETRKYKSSLSLNDLALASAPQSFMYLKTDPVVYILTPVQTPFADYVPLQVFP
jgi:predicted transcriptional regulator